MQAFNVLCHYRGKVICPASWRVNDKGVPFHRLYYMLGGSVVYTQYGKSTELQKDTLYLFPQMQQFTITHNPERPFHCQFFHLEFNPPVENRFFSFRIEPGSAAYFLLQALAGIPPDRYDKNDIVLKIIHSLLMEINAEAETPFILENKLSNVFNYIQANFCKKIQISVLAEYAGFDMNYFIRLFKKMFQVTPGEYLTKLKMAKAKELLSSGNTVYAVADQVGFDDAKSFSRSFKKSTGFAPVHFKKSQFLQP